MNKNEKIDELAEIIRKHAAVEAQNDWEREYLPYLDSVFTAAGFWVPKIRLQDRVQDSRQGQPTTITIQDREIPIETIFGTLRDAYLKRRTASYFEKMSGKLVDDAFRHVSDEEEKRGK